MTTSPRRRPARYRSIYANGCPVWECSRCGDRKPPGTREAELRRHENTCGQNTEGAR